MAFPLLGEAVAAVAGQAMADTPVLPVVAMAAVAAVAAEVALPVAAAPAGVCLQPCLSSCLQVKRRR